MSEITTQSKVLGLMVKCTAIPSILGSSYIAFEVLRNKRKRAKTYHRLLLAMSISDIMSSSTIFVGSWGIPKGTEGVYLAYGNETTCKIQGFFIQLGIVTPLYNGMLAVYYLLSINWGWKEYQIHSIEKYLHAAPLIWGFGTAIGCAAADVYSNATLWCWLGNKSEITNTLRYALYYGPVILMLLTTSTIMVMIYNYVRGLERAVEKHDFQRRVALEQRMQIGQQMEQQQNQNPSEGFRSSISKALPKISNYVLGLEKAIRHGSSGMNPNGSAVSDSGSTRKLPSNDGDDGNDIDVGGFDSNDNSDAESECEEEDCDADGDDVQQELRIHAQTLCSAYSTTSTERDGSSNLPTPSSSPGALKSSRKLSSSRLKHSTIVEDLSLRGCGGGDGGVTDVDDDENTKTVVVEGELPLKQRPSPTPSNLGSSRNFRIGNSINGDGGGGGAATKVVNLSNLSSCAATSDRATDSDDNDGRRSCDDNDSVDDFFGARLSATGSVGRATRTMRRKTKHSKRVMYQSLWYIVAFYFSFVFATTARIWGSVTGRAPFPLMLLFSIFFPMQGFFNFLVYMRSRLFKDQSKSTRTRRRSPNSARTRHVRRGSTNDSWNPGIQHQQRNRPLNSAANSSSVESSNPSRNFLRQ